MNREGRKGKLGPRALELSCMVKYKTDDSNSQGFAPYRSVHRHRWLQICVVHRSSVLVFHLGGGSYMHLLSLSLSLFSPTSGTYSDIQMGRKADRIKGRADAWFETAACIQGLANRRSWGCGYEAV